jgi:hypothetical protein
VSIPQKIDFPTIWEEDWAEAYESATNGVDREIVLSLGRGAHLLRDIKDKKFSFARLAWFCLWARTYWLLDSARKGLSAKSEYTLEVLERLSFELTLHVEVIAESDSIDRLRAYAAWCISADINYQKTLLKPETLDAIWNPEPARSIMKDTERLASHENLFGPITVDIDEKRLRRGRFRQQNQEQHRLHRMKSWLAHPELATWKLKLNTLAKNKKGQPTFFNVLSEAETSVRSRLRQKDRLFTYLAYSKGSLFVHGSTLEQFLSITPEYAAPRPLDDVEECQALAATIRGQCNGSFVLLHVLRQRLWDKNEAEGKRA